MPADSGEAGVGANIGTISGTFAVSLDSRKMALFQSPALTIPLSRV